MPGEFHWFVCVVSYGPLCETADLILYIEGLYVSLFFKVQVTHFCVNWFFALREEEKYKQLEKKLMKTFGIIILQIKLICLTPTL
jgi:hypothetical protein